VIEEPRISFVVEPGSGPAIQIRVNFGVFAGRQATPAEIDRLAERLLGALDSVTVVAEEWHEMGRGAVSTVHQIRVDVGREQLPEDGAGRAELAQFLLARAEAWAHECIDDRSVEPSE
jgi:hypothetical protein